MTTFQRSLTWIAAAALSVASLPAMALQPFKADYLASYMGMQANGTMTFRALAADAPDTMTRVARFLALLELFREGVVSFDQMTPLGELSIRWTGTEDTEIEITDEFDGAPPVVEPGPTDLADSPDAMPEEDA